MSLLMIANLTDDWNATTRIAAGLQRAGFDTLLFHDFQGNDDAGQAAIHQTLHEAQAVLVLIGQVTSGVTNLPDIVNTARQHHQRVVALIVQPTDPLPALIRECTTFDLTSDFERGLERLAAMLNRVHPNRGITLQEARDAYLQRADLNSRHTVQSYERAIDLFLEFLGDRRARELLPLQKTQFVTPGQIAVDSLTADDSPIFSHFVGWMLSASTGSAGDRRPYKPSTVALRLAGVLSWFRFMDDQGWLPGAFKLARARRIVSEQALLPRAGPGDLLRRPEGIAKLIAYYSHQQPPRALQEPATDPARLRQWELSRLRNHALIQSLAESGGRVSEVLSLNLSDFPVQALHEDAVLRVAVRGKSGHTYHLRFYMALPAIRAYIQARGVDDFPSSRHESPLFVSHAKQYEGQRMSRVVAWRVVQRAARALGLGAITPQDLRHWRATQLIDAGYSPDVVQEYLGHRSLQTTRAYYTRTDPQHLDEAARSTWFPEPDSVD